MFGQQKTTFGTPSTGFGGFGATTSTFGATNPTQTTGGFGATGSAFGQPQQQNAGGLFGATATSNTSGGLFGTPQTTTSTAFGQPQQTTGGFGNTSFGATSAFKPAGGFGTTSTGFGSSATTGGVFGATATSQPNQSSFGFGGTTNTGGAFGANAGSSTAFGAFGQQQQLSGTTVKFAPVTGTDTMMKSGVQTNINTRHQCISCMKEYETKSIEELRADDYAANRKGPQSGAAAPGAATGGLFSAAPNQTVSSSGGLFGTTTSQPQQAGGLFGQAQQQNKSMFGTVTSAAPSFGSTFGGGTSQFGAPATSTSGGLFGAAKPAGAFGAPATTAGFAFGQQQPTQANTGGLFGAQNQASAFNKPTAFGTPTTQSGGLFGATTGGFGTPAGAATAAPAFGATGTAFGATTTQPQSIGLFGNQNQAAKPALGFGAANTSFGAAQPATSTSFGFGAATNTFGAATAQQKPAAFGFGGNTATPGFGGFGTTQQPQATGGLFGATQNKPAGFGGTFGATSQAPSFGAATSSFGTFGQTNTSGSLFNANTQNKPFGTSFGTTSGGFGTGLGANTAAGGSFGFGQNSSFNLNNQSSSFGGGLTGGLNQQTQQPQQLPSIQSQLASLTSNPYGDNPLFKTLLPDNNRREEIMKPTNPAAQKAALLASSNQPQYKVSPRGSGLKAKVIPLSGNKNNSSNKSAFFDGLDEDDSVDAKSADLFVPRSSVKKLILKPKNALTLDDSSLNESNINIEDSLTLPSVKKLPVKTAAANANLDQPGAGDESYSANINTKKKELEDSTINLDQSVEVEVESELPQPAGIKLRRAGYYTIPNMVELATMVDQEGNLNVENFTIGRSGYGNIFFHGMTNIKNMNFDDIVFFRHKEVIVYPDDVNKPELGQGLNKKAQVTLDKVWPNDKTSGSPIKNSEKLLQLNYEEKLQKACIKLGARFVEYRAETGSWVFKVEHFSKYGLDDSDEDDQLEIEKKKETSKKLKTLQLREKPQPMSSMEIGVPNVTVHAEDLSPSSQSQGQQSSVLMRKDLQGHLQPSNLSLTSPMEETFQKISDCSTTNRVKLMKATLFEDEDMEVNEEIGGSNLASGGDFSQTSAVKSRPVVLERRSTTTAADPHQLLIEDIASSMLGGNTSRGLGGISEMHDTSHTTMTSSLLKSQYLSMVASMKSRPVLLNTNAAAGTHGGSSSKTAKKSKAPRYTLQAGYEKQIELPSQPDNEDIESLTVVPKHVDHFLPLNESILCSQNVRHYADLALFKSRQFRVCFGPLLTLANPGDSLASSKSLVRKEAATDVFLERSEPLEDLNEALVESYESWLEVELENSVLSFDHDIIPKLEVVEGLDALHAHAEEAERQLSITDTVSGLKDMKDVFDLCVALWGRLQPQRPTSEDGGADDVMEIQDEQQPAENAHKSTMDRKEAVTKWLETVTSEAMKNDLTKAKEQKSHLDEIMTLLSGNKRLEATEVAHSHSDHNLAMLIAMASGPNSTSGGYLQAQLERWQEGRADKFMEAKRLKIYSLLSGHPVWPGTDLTVNTCDGLDWRRAFGLHLWYLVSPASSIADALYKYEEAFQKETSQFGAYARPPRPEYDLENDEDVSLFDIRFHLLKLYANRAHQIEAIVAPRAYTDQPLDFKTGWIISQVLLSLGYRHMDNIKREHHHLDFAMQLESMGLWHWAIFVILHLQDPLKRSKLAKEILGRNVVPSDDDSAEREEFLQERLNVPTSWIAEAKATRASKDGNYGDQAWYLLRAESWNEAHKVIVEKIAPDAIINDDYEFFFSLLLDLANLQHEDNDGGGGDGGSKSSTTKKVTNWQTQGQVFYDFITVDLKVRELLEKRDETNLTYDIQELRPKVLSLCQRINSLPVTNAKERLCQSEIAKKMAYLTRAILNLQGDKNQNQTEILAQNLAQLPLPDDYMLQELRTLNRIHMKELLHHPSRQN